jgi:hypothetical protein
VLTNILAVLLLIVVLAVVLQIARTEIRRR